MLILDSALMMGLAALVTSCATLVWAIRRKP
jgi:hypothetical protein